MNRKTLLVAAGGLTVAAAALALAWFTRDRWPDPEDLVDAPRPVCDDPSCCGGLYGDHSDGVRDPADGE